MYNKARAVAFGFAPPLPLVQQYTPLNVVGRALDLGCGRGDEAVFLAEMGYTVDAFDAYVPYTMVHDEQIILKLLEDYASKHGLLINPMYGYLEDVLPQLPTNHYDVVIASYVLHFASLNGTILYKTSMPDIIRVLKPGGRLICGMTRSCLNTANNDQELMPLELRSQIVDGELEALWQRGLQAIYYNPANWEAFRQEGSHNRNKHCCWELVADKT